jgi:hypothetical protein
MLKPDWWTNLESLWKQAFAVTLFKHPDEPTPEELSFVYNATVMRFAGPAAPYPNMPFELTNLSGVSQLPNLEILVVTHHKIIFIKELENLQNLKSLFLFNNQIKNLEGIETLKNLEQLYVQCNQIESIRPIEKLINLKEVYVNQNLLSSLVGLTEEHSDKLTDFFCKPNDLLKQKEIIRVERDLGILCR